MAAQKHLQPGLPAYYLAATSHLGALEAIGEKLQEFGRHPNGFQQFQRWLRAERNGWRKALEPFEKQTR
jgi:hypothetical protein